MISLSADRSTPASQRYRGRFFGGWRELLAAVLMAAGLSPITRAIDVSPPPILQWFDSTYATQERRVADLFMAGYGSVWLPPTGRADSGGQSVGYDVFDRFDLGSPGRPTLYGTEQGLRSLTGSIHRAGGSVYLDLIWNHNGFSDRDRPGFVTEGGYPGFVLTRPGAPDGDFHAKTDTGDLNGRLSGLIDIQHETTWQYIRSPVDPADPRNIPAGTRWNRPDPGNRRFYPDAALPGRTAFNPLTGQTVTLREFNTADPAAGDPVTENATGLLMRNARWLINDVGVDGFRLDAARHFEPWVMGYFDEAVFGASRRVHLDGTPYEVFSFSEAATTDKNRLLSQFVRKDAGRLPAGQISGNRDALDFAQFWPIVQNLSANGIQNDFRAMARAGLDHHDDGIINGSAGVVFVQSHDDFGPALSNVAHAFALMRPGNALVYYNAYEHYDPFRDFPKAGRGDALGNFGTSITDLVDLRNRYGRGDYRERLLEKENFAFERSGAALVMLSNRNDGGFDSRTIAVDFAPGTRLVELTGNAARVNAAAGSTVIPEVLPVSGSRTVSGRFLRNDGRDQGYLVYGLATPASAAGLTFSGPGVGPVLSGDAPPVFQGGETSTQTGTILVANAKARLADLQVITGDSFAVRLATDPVTLPGGFRDRSADGDQAMLRINGGLDLNGTGVVDVIAPDDVAYGFENFSTTRLPGYFQADGRGLYEQVIDATTLPEGMNFLTARAFRHRDPATGGDGGPAVYTDFRSVLYVDRLPPESAFDGFRPLAGAGNNEVWIRSLDGTADAVHVFRNVAAGVSDESLLAQAAAGIGRADAIDRDLFKSSFLALPAGHNSLAVVTREITGRTNVQRFTGLVPGNGRGAGFGDLNADGMIAAADISGTTYGFESVLLSRNTTFNPAADLDGDGLVDTRDLLALETRLTLSGSIAALDALQGVKFRRVNFAGGERLDEADLGVLRAHVGLTTGFDLWSYDLDVDGLVTSADIALAQDRFGLAQLAVPSEVTWTGGDGLPGGAGTWTTAALAWQGGVTDPALAMPLVPGARAVFSGSEATVTVAGSVRAVGGISVETAGATAIDGGSIWLGGTEGLASDVFVSNEVAVAAGSQASIGSVLSGSSGLMKTGAGSLELDAVNAFSGPVLVASGTLGLGAAGGLGGSSLIELAPGSVLDVASLSGGYSVAAGQTLSGGGTVIGSVIFGVGATLSPGLRSQPPEAVVAAVPEPAAGTWALLGLLAAVALGAHRRSWGAAGRLDAGLGVADHARRSVGAGARSPGLSVARAWPGGKG
jgi:alpha-amylase